MDAILQDIHRFLGVFREDAEEQQATSDAFLKRPALGGVGTWATRNTDQFYYFVSDHLISSELAQLFLFKPETEARNHLNFMRFETMLA